MIATGGGLAALRRGDLQIPDATVLEPDLRSADRVCVEGEVVDLELSAAHVEDTV